MNSFITSIATANPPHKIEQHQVLEFMIKAHNLNKQEAKKLEVLYRATGIRSRYSVIQDYQSPLVRDFFPDNENLEPFPSTNDRLQLFKREAIKLSLKASQKVLNGTSPNQVTHLITVSCTGMYAPGIDIELVDLLGLNSHVERTGINFMGCYAAFNAIKVADAICTAHDDAVVLIVCVELCSIHLQKEKLDDNLLANALFGDGAAAMLIRSRPVSGINLKSTAFFNGLHRNGHDDMAWKIGDFGFEMRLSAYVPEVIRSGISTLTKKLMVKSEINEFDFLAVHPGGKKILQVIEEELKRSRADNQAAHDILSNYGNMSSPTILFVLKKLHDQLKATDDTKTILALAFGPGLTLESMLLTVENH